MLTEYGSTILTEVVKVVIVVEMAAIFLVGWLGFSKSKCCHRFKNAARRKRLSW